ncbi:uncharacterized protein [Clytia hemisphaerica]|uniref:uncharacterized protein n=1 Tax=Clytia hemisphaerica TaxID=252671 RepID=UPI0034D6E6B1
MSSTRQNVVTKSDYWIRVNLALEFCVKDALLSILHNLDNDPSYQGLPQNPGQLYQHMLTCKQNTKNGLHKILKQDEWDKLCPQNKQQTDSKDWDITLIVAVIRNETNLKPSGGWKNVKSTDQSKAAFVDRARQLRNEIKHGNAADLDTVAKFNSCWNKIESILLGLKYQNMTFFHDLRTSSLDKYNAEILKIVKNFKHDLDSLSNQATDNAIEIRALKLKIKSLEQTQAMLNCCEEFKKINQDLDTTKKMIEKELFDTKETLKKDLIDSSKSTTVEITQKQPFYWDLRLPVANFFGREKVIKDIKVMFDSSNCVAISALGGTGKTQTAAKFVDVNKYGYDKIFWINAKSLHKTLCDILYMISKEVVPPKESLVLVCQLLTKYLDGKKVLFMVDDVFEEHLNDLKTFLSNVSSQKISILLTTQLNEFDDPKIVLYKLQLFESEEGKLFLRDNLPNATREEIDSLAEELQSFPLVLQQAVSYIKKHGTKISTYILSFKESNSSLLHPKKKLSDYDKTLLTVWSLAFEQLKSSPKAWSVLAMMAFMDNSCIKKETFLYFKEISDEIELNEILDEICSLSLVQQSESHLHIHALVQKVICISLETGVFKTSINEIALMLKELLNNIAMAFSKDEFHTDEKDLWYIHAKNLWNVLNEKDLLGKIIINITTLFRTADSRFDIPFMKNYYINNEKCLKMYRITDDFAYFISALELKNLRLEIMYSNDEKVELEDIQKFEREFAKELTKPHEKVFSYKIRVAFAFNHLKGKEYKSFSKRINEVYDCLISVTGMNSIKLKLADYFVNNGDNNKAETIIGRLSISNLTVHDKFQMFDTEIRISIKNKNLTRAGKQIEELEQFLMSNNIPLNHGYRQRFNSLKSRYSFVLKRYQDALNIIEKSSLPYKQGAEFRHGKALILIKLHRHHEARALLPNDEDCLPNRHLSFILSYIKFMINDFDMIPMLHAGKAEILTCWIEVYAIAHKQFQTLKNDGNRAQDELIIILRNMVLFKKAIIDKFDGMFIL